MKVAKLEAGRLLLAGIALAAGVSSAHAQQEAVTMALPTLSLTFSAAYVAEDLGLYEKAGLKANVVNIPGVGAINSVISGSSDFAQTTAGSFTRAAARGQRMLAIANLLERPMIEVVMRKELALASGFDPAAPLDRRGQALKGRTLAVDSVNSIVHGYLRIVALRAGLDPERDMRISPMQPASMIAAFQAKAIDGFAMSQPWTLMPVGEQTAVTVASSPRGDLPELVPFGYNLLVTRPALCEQRRSVCEKMGKVYVEAIRYIHENPAGALQIMRKRFAKMDAGLLEAAFGMIATATPRVPEVTRVGLENAEIYNVEAGLMRPEEKLKSYDDLFTNQFVR